ncbi:hypothetical protein ACVU7I_04905 [Patulibacter sp. S7RM1-6]
MRPFLFRHTTRGALHRYAHTPGDAVVVDASNRPVLAGPWPDDRPTPLTRHAVDVGNAEEIAVYLGFVWRLTEGRARHAIPCYYRDQAARVLGRAGRFVAWEYEVDAEGTDADARDTGFVPARAAVPIRPEPTAFEREHRRRAGLFRLDTYADLVGVTRATLGDASAEVSVFAVADDRLGALVDALRGPERPDLADLLGADDLFVDLTIGVDLGYHDSVIVHSRGDITERLTRLAREYEAAVTRYESRVPGTTTVEALLHELDRLARGE